VQPAYSPTRLPAILPLPIDYYVLKSAHRLPTIRPVFENEKFVVYDATDLANPARMPGWLPARSRSMPPDPASRPK